MNANEDDDDDDDEDEDEDGKKFQMCRIQNAEQTQKMDYYLSSLSSGD